MSIPKGTVAAAALMTLVALATIAAAWGFQLIGGFIPCKLCLQERIPYYVGLPFAAAALAAAFARLPERAVRALLAVAGLVFLVGAALGVYHAGVEYGWWLGPSDCGAGAASDTRTTGDLLAQLSNIRVVSCSEASWRFPPQWGLSFAGWNAVIAAGLALVGFAGAFGRQKTV